MPSCVSETSYNVMFGLCIAVMVVFLLSVAFNLNLYAKADDKTITSDDTRTAKHVSQATLIAVLVMLGVVLFMYFGNTKRLVGVYTNIPLQQQ